MDITALKQAVTGCQGEDAFRVRLTPAQWQELAAVMRPLELQPGQPLLRCGDVDDKAFLVESGELQVYLTGGGPLSHRIATLRAGSVVGEPGLFGAAPRLAHVEAVKRTVVWSLPAAALQQLAGRDPALVAEVLRAAGVVMAARMRANLERGIPVT